MKIFNKLHAYKWLHKYITINTNLFLSKSLDIWYW